MTRTSTRRVRDEPTRSNSPVSSTRSSLACCDRPMLAISSRNSVPPSASSKRPMRSALASVKAPFTWPNSSLSNTPSARPPALTVTRACRRGGDGVEPAGHHPLAGAVLAGDQHVGVGRRRPARSARAPAASPATRRSDRGRRPRRAGARFSASSRWRRRSARPSSTWVRRCDSRRALSQGFSMKSRAPRRIASTASSTLPQAVITTTGRVASRARIRASRSRPSRPEVVSRV